MPHLLYRPELIQGPSVSYCPACGGTNLTSLGGLPEAFHFCSFYYRHPINRATLIECRTCDFHFRNPCLSSEMLEDLYRQQPATVWGTTLEDRVDVPQMLPFLKRMEHSEIRILDVGCYTGGLLRSLNQVCPDGKSLDCYGIEPSKEAAAQAAANGIKIVGATIEDLDASVHRFDIIVLTDVFEHILHSKDFLQSLCRFLSPGGYLMIMTGAFDSAPFNRYRNTYHYCATPEHVAFISKRHAQWLASELGMSLVDYTIMSHSPVPPSRVKNLIKSLIYRVSRWIPTPWLCVDSRWAKRLAWFRGLGVQNLSAHPDHAFVVLQLRNYHHF